ncbi:MAG: NAD(P)H-hydrate dehydratase [Bacteroidetes bacterium]|nr:MAG: NAD(P)H-hydrate dehydratase [Bacteroidota bacterium]
MLLSTAAQIREADRIQIEEKQVPGILLMEQAGRMAALKINELYPSHMSFLVLAGPGNNGGDGLVIARYLHLAGKEVQVLLSHEPERYKGDALINHRILSELPVPLLLYTEDDLDEVLASFDQTPLLIDALLGTGIRDPLRGTVAEIIGRLATRPNPVIAIDLPSGLDADTGEQINPVLVAVHTLTFQLPKICHYVTPAANTCGQVHVLDIGIWPEVIDQLNIRRSLITHAFLRKHYRPRNKDAHKGSYGHVLMVGGSRFMPGAVALATYAASCAGAGLVTAFTPEVCRQSVSSLCPEAMCIFTEGPHLGPRDLAAFDAALKGKSVVALGPGIGTHPDTLAFLTQALPMIQVPLVLDADGLNLLASHPELWLSLPDPVILTPHPGEMARLTGRNNINERRLEAAERLAQDRNVILVLKGAGTLVALPDGRTYVNTTGNPGMASGGSGDVLTGILAACLAQGYPAEVAAPLGVFLHGKAGDLAAQQVGMEGVTARRIAEGVRW